MSELHTKTGPSKVGDLVSPPGADDLWIAFPQDLPRQYFLGHSGQWPNQRSWDLSIQRKRVLTIRALWI